MRKHLALVAAVAAVAGIAATSASAGQPANPGCFGQDRAAWIQENGGATWGAIASDRAGTNGDLNQAYKIYCGGTPT